MSDPSTFPCHDCGADLEYSVGSLDLRCPYCGAANTIPTSNSQVFERDYEAWLGRAASDAASMDVITVHCKDCGANPTLGEGITADRCPFCASPIVAQGQSVKAIRPHALLPFRVTRDEALKAFRAWIADLWFAPNALLPTHIADRLSGVYIPFWTFDCRTTATYTGEQGTHYTVIETVTETDAQGNTQEVEREVIKTRWCPAAGTVVVPFDDLLVHASPALPSEKVKALEPWDLSNLVDFDDRFLAGFRAESAGSGLEEGFSSAINQMRPAIEATIRRDIGGDDQRIHGFEPTYSDITFKHLLLPIWISAFRFKEKAYRIVINGRTAEVQGERPYSPWKIIGFILMLAALAALAYLLYTRM